MSTFDESIYTCYESTSPFEIRDVRISVVNADVLGVPDDEREFVARFRKVGEDLPLSPA